MPPAVVYRAFLTRNSHSKIGVSPALSHYCHSGATDSTILPLAIDVRKPEAQSVMLLMLAKANKDRFPLLATHSSSDGDSRTCIAVKTTRLWGLLRKRLEGPVGRRSDPQARWRQKLLRELEWGNSGSRKQCRARAQRRARTLSSFHSSYNTSLRIVASKTSVFFDLNPTREMAGERGHSILSYAFRTVRSVP